jgi:hypothetical protein
MVAAIEGHLGAVKMLLNRGADVGAKDDDVSGVWGVESALSPRHTAALVVAAGAGGCEEGSDV